MKYKYLFFFIILCSFKSCIIDSLSPFCYVSNESKRNITVRFSNADTLDMNTIYERWNSFISPNSVVLMNKYEDKYFKDFYKNNGKVLYMYVLDQDSLSKFDAFKDTVSMIQNAFLQRQIVDVKHLEETDTLHYSNN